MIPIDAWVLHWRSDAISENIHAVGTTTWLVTGASTRKVAFGLGGLIGGGMDVVVASTLPAVLDTGV